MIETPNFSLDLEPPWQEVPGEDPEHYNFRDDTRDLLVTVSAMALHIAPDAVAQFASLLVDTRFQAEVDAGRALDRRATVYEPIIVPQPWGNAVAYYGHDVTGRQFSFSGSVTPRCAISLYGSSDKLSERGLLAAMDEVASRIAFDRRPLDAAFH